MCKKILRPSEANVTENRDRLTQTLYCGLAFVLGMFVTCLLDALLEYPAGRVFFDLPNLGIYWLERTGSEKSNSEPRIK